MVAQSLGSRGEDLAALFLERGGWTVLHRNYRVGRREIDLVVRRGEVVAFVEVKTRRGLGFGHPLEAITRRKQAEIRQVASAWIERHGGEENEYRFDAVSVLFATDSSPTIEHLENAWQD